MDFVGAKVHAVDSPGRGPTNGMERAMLRCTGLTCPCECTLACDTRTGGPSATQEPRNAPGEADHVRRFAFPNDENVPAESAKLHPVDSVSLAVSCELRAPVLVIEGARAPASTAMLMPETAVDENHFVTRRKNNVRPSRQIADMKAKSIAERVGGAAYGQLGLCIGRANSRHVVAASLPALRLPQRGLLKCTRVAAFRRFA